MKTKNVRLRLKDIKHGVVFYVSHPVYGISKNIALGKPYLNAIGYFVNCLIIFDDGESYKDSRSLGDAGIMPGESYNHRRSFRKLKQAEEWRNKMITDKGFIAAQTKHEESCRDWFWGEE